ncbi:hypothetical protein ABG067_003520 [Albugo candida]
MMARSKKQITAFLFPFVILVEFQHAHYSTIAASSQSVSPYNQIRRELANEVTRVHFQEKRGLQPSRDQTRSTRSTGKFFNNKLSTKFNRGMNTLKTFNDKNVVPRLKTTGSSIKKMFKLAKGKIQSMYALTTSTATSLAATGKKRVISVIQRMRGRGSESKENTANVRNPPQPTTNTRTQADQTKTGSGMAKGSLSHPVYPLPQPSKENYQSKPLRRNANYGNSETSKVLTTRLGGTYRESERSRISEARSAELSEEGAKTHGAVKTSDKVNPSQTTTNTRTQTDQGKTGSGIAKGSLSHPVHPLPQPPKKNFKSEPLRANANNGNGITTKLSKQYKEGIDRMKTFYKKKVVPRLKKAGVLSTLVKDKVRPILQSTKTAATTLATTAKKGVISGMERIRGRRGETGETTSDETTSNSQMKSGQSLASGSSSSGTQRGINSKTASPSGSLTGQSLPQSANSASINDNSLKASTSGKDEVRSFLRTPNSAATTSGTTKKKKVTFKKVTIIDKLKTFYNDEVVFGLKKVGVSIRDNALKASTSVIDKVRPISQSTNTAATQSSTIAKKGVTSEMEKITGRGDDTGETTSAERITSQTTSNSKMKTGQSLASGSSSSGTQRGINSKTASPSGSLTGQSLPTPADLKLVEPIIKQLREQNKEEIDRLETYYDKKSAATNDIDPQTPAVYNGFQIMFARRHTEATEDPETFELDYNIERAAINQRLQGRPDPSGADAKLNADARNDLEMRGLIANSVGGFTFSETARGTKLLKYERPDQSRKEEITDSKPVDEDSTGRSNKLSPQQ